MDSFRSKCTRTTAKFTFGGQEYESLDDLPLPFRKLLEDRDPVRYPDWIQDHAAAPGSARSSRTIEMTTINGVTTYKVDGQQYDNLEAMPEEFRSLFEDRNVDGLPDLLSGRPGLSKAEFHEGPQPTVDVGQRKAEPVPQPEPMAAEVVERRSSSARLFEPESEGNGKGVWLCIFFALFSGCGALLTLCLVALF